MSFRGAMLLALVACGPGKDPSESEDTGAPEEGEDSGVNTGVDSGDTDDETGESGVETGEGEGETGGETTETGETGETGETTETGDTGGDTGGDTASTSPPVSSRCIEDSDDIGFCTHGVYAEDWSGSARYEWALTDGYNHSVLTKIEGDSTTRIAAIQTTSSWHATGGLTVLPDGDLLLAGITLPYVTLTINDTSVSLGSDYVRFIARVSADGELEWVQTFIGISGESVVVASRSDGSAVVSGFLWVATEFGDYDVSTTMFFDLAFAAAISGDGEWLWATAPAVASSGARAYFDDMTVGDGDIASVDVRYTGSLTLDDGTYTCPTGSTCSATASVSTDGAWTDLVSR